MQRATKLTLAFYLFWTALWVAIAVAGPYLGFYGELGVSAQIWLMITGFPLALLSIFVPNGTLLGVISAGLLGSIQWAAAAEIVERERLS